ncbi:IclR family transcriptional regulator [Amycolatopsis alkalitolerans]|uniref:IclR family transcriptional regulator n=1 Tax=Amycolatopsis alkalitolerans TaxID=2547244 RepID=UPI001F2A01AF|nr:IclR family transcriptional regulator [Amycolatopsis alkalitolerans]
MTTVDRTPAARQVAGTQTIARALAVLRVLRDARDDLGGAEIAKVLGLHASTAHRILKALVVAGYVVQNERTERYRLGPESFLLGRAAGRTLGFDAAAPVLERLAEATGESVNLVVRDGDEGVVVVRVDSWQPLRFTQPVGARIPLYCTSSGKALLAFAGDAAAQIAGLGELTPLTPATVTSPRALLTELRDTWARGYSLNRGERIAGVRGVAAPVLGEDGQVIAAVAVQGPEIRITEAQVPELGALVVETARAVSAVMPPGSPV